MRIITFTPLKEFGEANPQVMASIRSWYKIAESKTVDWKKPQDVESTFGSSRVDILQNDRVCINIAGNDVRLVLKIKYKHAMAYVRWIGWHKDYNTLGQKIHSI